MTRDVKESWRECLEIIQDNLTQDIFTYWFAPIEAVSFEGNILTLKVPSYYYCEHIDSTFAQLIGMVLGRVFGPKVRLQYQVLYDRSRPGMPEYTTTLPSASSVGSQPQRVNLVGRVEQKELPNPFVIPGIRQIQIDPQLKPDYCFENFVSGECNRMALEAGRAIVYMKEKSSSFNPLIIYGASGLGKTHLAQAIGIGMREEHPEKVVLYVGATQFMNQFLAARERQAVPDFVNFYHNINVLIVDDIHELATREGTQNVLFGIFNHLHMESNQLIFTTDRAPVDLKGIRSELLSRFKWGLSVELTAPDEETRFQILKGKSFRDGILSVPEEVLRYIASQVTTNVRELEGALISVMAHSTLDKQDVTLELASRVLGKLVEKPKERELSIQDIQKEVGRYYNLSLEELNSVSRRRQIVQARQIAMYIAKEYTRHTLASIGEEIGGKSHATVLHACNTIRDLMGIDRHVRNDVQEIERILELVPR